MFNRDNPYFRQVALIIDLLPLIGEETCFALKGGTAINLFVRDGSAPEEVLGDAFDAADAGDWARFIEVMGGLSMRRADYLVRITRRWSDQPNRYEEPLGYRTLEIEAGPVILPTRERTWTICRITTVNDSTINGMPDNREPDPLVKNGMEFGVSAPLEFCQ